jgi:hypothetical protein
MGYGAISHMIPSRWKARSDWYVDDELFRITLKRVYSIRWIISVYHTSASYINVVTYDNEEPRRDSRASQTSFCLHFLRFSVYRPWLTLDRNNYRRLTSCTESSNWVITHFKRSRSSLICSEIVSCTSCEAFLNSDVTVLGLFSLVCDVLVLPLTNIDHLV